HAGQRPKLSDPAHSLSAEARRGRRWRMQRLPPRRSRRVRCSACLGRVVMAINMSKSTLVMKHRNAPSHRPNENNVAIKDEMRACSDELAQALSATEERLTRCDRKTIVSDQDNLAGLNRRVSKDSVEQIHLGVDKRSATVVLLPSRNDAASNCDARQLCILEDCPWRDA